MTVLNLVRVMLLLHADSDVIADLLATLCHNNNNTTLTEVKAEKMFTLAVKSTQGLPGSKDSHEKY